MKVNPLALLFIGVVPEIQAFGTTTVAPLFIGNRIIRSNCRSKNVHVPRKNSVPLLSSNHDYLKYKGHVVLEAGRNRYLESMDGEENPDNIDASSGVNSSTNNFMEPSTEADGGSTSTSTSSLSYMDSLSAYRSDSNIQASTEIKGNGMETYLDQIDNPSSTFSVPIIDNTNANGNTNIPDDVKIYNNNIFQEKEESNDIGSISASATINNINNNSLDLAEQLLNSNDIKSLQETASLLRKEAEELKGNMIIIEPPNGQTLGTSTVNNNNNNNRAAKIESSVDTKSTPNETIMNTNGAEMNVEFVNGVNPPIKRSITVNPFDPEDISIPTIPQPPIPTNLNVPSSDPSNKPIKKEKMKVIKNMEKENTKKELANLASELNSQKEQESKKFEAMPFIGTAIAATISGVILFSLTTLDKLPLSETSDVGNEIVKSISKDAKTSVLAPVLDAYSKSSKDMYMDEAVKTMNNQREANRQKSEEAVKNGNNKPEVVKQKSDNPSTATTTTSTYMEDAVKKMNRQQEAYKQKPNVIKPIVPIVVDETKDVKVDDSKPLEEQKDIKMESPPLTENKKEATVVTESIPEQKNSISMEPEKDDANVKNEAVVEEGKQNDPPSPPPPSSSSLESSSTDTPSDSLPSNDQNSIEKSAESTTQATSTEPVEVVAEQNSKLAVIAPAQLLSENTPLETEVKIEPEGTNAVSSNL